MEETLKLHDVKVVRLDDRNFSVLQVVSVDDKETGRRGGKKLGTSHLEWREQAYYGMTPHSLVLACEYALAIGVKGSTTKDLIQSVKDTEKSIQESLRPILALLKKEQKDETTESTTEPTVRAVKVHDDERSVRRPRNRAKRTTASKGKR